MESRNVSERHDGPTTSGELSVFSDGQGSFTLNWPNFNEASISKTIVDAHFQMEDWDAPDPAINILGDPWCFCKM